MPTWLTLQARPVEPVRWGTDIETASLVMPAPEYWQLRVCKDAAETVEGIRIVCEWSTNESIDGGPAVNHVRNEVWEIPDATINTSPVGTVLHTIENIGPMAGSLSIEIDLYGGLQAFLDYPTLQSRYQVDML